MSKFVQLTQVLRSVPTAQSSAIEDISLMRTLPNMTVINPADAKEAEAAVLAAIDYQGPVTFVSVVPKRKIYMTIRITLNGERRKYYAKDRM